MSESAGLDLLLHDRRIEMLARLDGNRSIFTFRDANVANKDRSTLSPTRCPAPGSDQAARPMRPPGLHAAHVEALENMRWPVLTIWQCQWKEGMELKENIHSFSEADLHAVD